MRRLILALIFTFPVFADDFTYVYNRGDGVTSISRGSLEEILRLRKQLRGTYLWARIGRDGYIVRDAASLAEAERAFGPLRAHDQKLRALHEKLDPIQERAERLERRIDALTDLDEDEDLSAADRDRLHQYERQLRALEDELRKYEAEERKLEDREEELDRAVDVEIERIIRRAVRDGRAERLR
jgi:chromosome segregation ATPase